MSNIPKTVAFDFDGVLATYDGFKGVDIFGEPIPETIKATQELKKLGYCVIIFTTRLDTPKLREWLKKHKVAYDAINKNPNQPPHTAFKPVWHCYIGDRALCFNVNGARWETNVILKAVNRIVKEARKKND